MNYPDYYTYPALINYYDDGEIYLQFPDVIECGACARNISDVLRNAAVSLSLQLFRLEEAGETIPEPTNIFTIEHEKNQVVSFVQVYMPPVREAHSKKTINKMVTLPEWLVKAGKEAGVNFSQVLREALLKKLSAE